MCSSVVEHSTNMGKNQGLNPNTQAGNRQVLQRPLVVSRPLACSVAQVPSPGVNPGECWAGTTDLARLPSSRVAQWLIVT